MAKDLYMSQRLIVFISGNRLEMLYEDPKMSKNMKAGTFLKVKYNRSVYTYIPSIHVGKQRLSLD